MVAVLALHQRLSRADLTYFKMPASDIEWCVVKIKYTETKWQKAQTGIAEEAITTEGGGRRNVVLRDKTAGP